MINSLTKAMIGMNTTRKIIEDINEDEWVLGCYDNSNLLLETDDKTKHILNSKNLYGLMLKHLLTIILLPIKSATTLQT